MKQTLPFLLLICFLTSFSQVDLPLDTINIYKSKSGIGFNKYMHHWFHHYGFLSSYSYDLKKLNKQDSLVMYDNEYHYFNIYDSKNRLCMAAANAYSPYISGDIKYYYKNGNLKRIEHYNNKLHIDTCGFSALLNDAPDKEGKWYYYRKDKTLKKTKEYFMRCVSCENGRMQLVKKTIYYNRKAKIKWVSKKRKSI